MGRADFVIFQLVFYSFRVLFALSLFFNVFRHAFRDLFLFPCIFCTISLVFWATDWVRLWLWGPGGPRRLPEAQEGPQKALRTPQELQEGRRRLPEGPQETPECLQEAPFMTVIDIDLLATFPVLSVFHLMSPSE